MISMRTFFHVSVGSLLLVVSSARAATAKIDFGSPVAA